MATVVVVPHGLDGSITEGSGCGAPFSLLDAPQKGVVKATSLAGAARRPVVEGKEASGSMPHIGRTYDLPGVGRTVAGGRAVGSTGSRYQAKPSSPALASG